MEKLILIPLIILSNLKLFLLKIRYMKSIRYNVISMISPKLRIKIIGKNSILKIGAKARIMSGGVLRVSNGSLIIGNCTDFRENTVIESNKGNIKIGDSVFLNRNCNIISCERIEIGDGTSLGGSVFIYDHDHIYKREGHQPWNRVKTSPVIIGKNVWIGANTVILRGANIGDNAVIAAGSIIKGDIPGHTLAYQEKKLILKDIR